MRRCHVVACGVVFSLLILSLLSLLESPVAASGYTCFDFQNWESAQVIYDHDRSTRDALDPDGTGVACNWLSRGGFAPAYWTNEIPDNVVKAEITGVIDGDTLTVTIDGQPDTVRLYRSDAPETGACGGLSATEFTQQALSKNDEGTTIYLESDRTDRDRYDRKLAYVWWMIDGKPYMLNEVLMRSGWARDVDYGDRMHNDNMVGAAASAQKWQLGAWSECGGFDAGAASGSGTTAPAPKSGPGAESCDPSYPDACIPPIEVTGDLDCGQITYSRFTVLPPDPHGFDRDRDGIGCESKR